jgi:hypothetical protein
VTTAEIDEFSFTALFPHAVALLFGSDDAPPHDKIPANSSASEKNGSDSLCPATFGLLDPPDEQF